MAGGDLEIADLAITAPADDTTVAVPATFTWQGRNLAGATYQWFLDGVADFGACDQPSAATSTSFTFTDLDCNFPSVPTATPLSWSVAIYGADGGEGLSQPHNVLFAR